MIRTLLAAALAPALLAAPASAQMFSIPDSERETYVDIGAALLSRAAYVGSEEQDTNIFPYAAGEYEGRLFFNPAIGAGVNLINDGSVQLAAVGTFATGRDATDTPFVFEPDDDSPVNIAPSLPLPKTGAVEDAFELDGSFVAGGHFNVLLPVARFDVTAVTPVTGDIEGIRTDFALTTRLPVGPVFIAPGVRATWTSDSWTESYYGFTTEQVNLLAAQGLFSPDFLEATDVGDAWTLGAHVLATWEVVDDVNIIGALNYSALQGDAKSSPFSPDNSGLTAVAGIAKRF